jgi:hypothetical protein
MSTTHGTCGTLLIKRGVDIRVVQILVDLNHRCDV